MKTLSELLSDADSYALLDDSKSSDEHAKNLLFSNPQHEIIAWQPHQLTAALKKIEQYQQAGLYLCGYLSYEAGYHFIDKTIEDTKQGQQPLLYFIAFKDLQRPTRAQINHCFENASLCSASELCLHDLQLNETKPHYLKTIATIKDYITSGDTYQINYTLKYKFKLQGRAASLYKALRKIQPVEFGALLNFPQSQIVSLSPELFIKKGGEVLTSKPMKGTAKRGKDKQEDEAIIQFLENDPKTLSENVMIVDLIRNDFGRICQTGSVAVKGLFQVQTFKTIHQMISTVTGRLNPSLSFSHILQALFPCGSITGAPKIRTMEIINQLESEARGIYTGAIGYLLPNDDFYFNVPIRTIAIGADKQCEMGIGSGIIYESDAEDEYQECLLKADFLTRINQHFHLIESFCFDANQQIFLQLEQHLARLAQSAKYFGFKFEKSSIEEKLEQLKPALNSGLYKIRLSLYQMGRVDINHESVIADTETKTVVISQQAIDSQSIFQHHKTSHRQHYNQAYDAASQDGHYDVIFFNEQDQLVEASRHNIFIQRQGQYYTPPLSAGALNGIARQLFIQKMAPQIAPQKKVEEVALSLKDLQQADEIWLSNSVRGMVKVELA